MWLYDLELCIYGPLVVIFMHCISYSATQKFKKIDYILIIFNSKRFVILKELRIKINANYLINFFYSIIYFLKIKRSTIYFFLYGRNRSKILPRFLRFYDFYPLKPPTVAYLRYARGGEPRELFRITSYVMPFSLSTMYLSVVFKRI